MKIALVSALAAATLAATPAFAQGGGRSIAVPHADLDLGRAEDRARLDLRLLHAARAVCGPASPADPYGRQRLADCVTEARSAADRLRTEIIARAQRSAGPVLASGQ